MKKIRLLMVVMAVGVLASYPISRVDAWEPPKGQVDCIAAAGVGGGPDMICRSTAGVLQKTGLLKPGTSMYVTNMPGGSGAVAIAHVVDRRKGDVNMFMAASSALTTSIALKRTPYTYDDITPLAQIGDEVSGYFVKADSKYKNLSDLINALKAAPNSVTFGGGSAPGSLNHLMAALLAKEIGVDPTKIAYVPYSGGGDVLASLLGGHVDVSCQELSENLGQLEAGTLRCLAILSEKRSTKMKDIPTTYEQGVKLNMRVWRGLFMAQGVPEEAVKFWSDTIRKMVATREWEAEAQRLGWELSFKFDDEFSTFLKKETADYQIVLKVLGFVK